MTADETEAAPIIAVATRLFAQLGFDGTSMGMVADAAGLDPATLTERIGMSKSDLYRAVMERAHEAQKVAVGDALASFTPTGTALADLADRYLDYYARNPETVGLWLHRRMGDAADISDLEERYIRPPFVRVAEALRGRAPDIDVDYALWSIYWVMTGFFSTGVMHTGASGHRHGTGLHLLPEDIEDFRRHLRRLVTRLLPLPE
ncbi:hypothetical protein GCM10023085_14520 [Actinomadura viridis]|uniref:AcrR family transcriptional regulator n=1 Tax=Actinomadura viridis TaxID=58110 RepID=A0A931DMB3_9ACTN|nr:TetR/AcrR family transcriptional regulator [Actinomadura viridis]MBG6093824.1 AcrR family transcriptional regulator [Actinomadura viridis]